MPNQPKPHIYVPMPQAKSIYGEGSLRDQFIRRYGEVSVMHAEVAVCVTILSELGVIKKSEFVDLVKSALEAADRKRQLQAEAGGRA